MGDHLCFVAVTVLWCPSRSGQLAPGGSRWLLIFLFCKNLVKVHSALPRTSRKSPPQWEFAVLIQLRASLPCQKGREHSLVSLFAPSTDPLLPRIQQASRKCVGGENGVEARPCPLLGCVTLLGEPVALPLTLEKAVWPLSCEVKMLGQLQ